jgi:TonB-linked SusC/RagA family outer membrane protein
MRKLLTLLMCITLAISQLMAQNRTVTGKVTDESGKPVPNASVIEKGTKKGTVTDDNGIFSLNISSGAKTLVISSVNFTVQEIAVSGKTNVAVSLTSITQNLDEVVVTAYGTTKKKSFTGTASTINAEKFKDLQVSSLTGVLQGQASGVLAISSNGQPGENPTIRVRGIGSVNASSDPLILLDGAPYGGNINNLNPNDIESITVLKDASSTALYGSRAANGVLQITTKTGKGTPRVAISALTGFSSRAVNDYSYVSSNQLYELTWESLFNEATLNPSLVSAAGASSAADYASKTVVGKLVYNPFKDAQPVGLDGKIKSGLPMLWNENWGNDLTRVGIRRDINGSISGGTDKTKYFISGGYLDDNGVAIESNFKRYTGRLKLDTKVNDWLSAGLNTNLAYSTQNYPVQGGSAYSNIVQWIRTVSSLYPEYLVDPATGNFLLDANGNKQYDFGNNGPLSRPPGVFNPGNPAATTSMNPTLYNRFITSANTYVEAQIIKGLKFRSQYALDYYQYSFNQYYNPFVGDGAAYGGRSQKTRETTTTQTFTNTLTYDKQLAKDHHLNVIVGMEAYRYHDESVTAEARGFTFPGVTELGYASTPYTATSASYDNRMASYFSRLNYDYTDKYHLSLSLRRDGSSRFADSVRWGTFYSVGGAWNINKENFLKNVSYLSDLKLRASYGTTGNQGTSGYFPYLGGYASGWNIAGYSGSIISTLSNGNLTWESQKTLDLGIDFGFLKNRITGSVTYFTRTSDKLLFARPLPPSSGIGSITDNIGTVKNSGFEIDLTTVNIRNKHFEWTTSFNISHIKNEITALPQTAIAGSGYSNMIVGQQLYNFYIREYAGVDKTDGTPMWFIDQTDASGNVTKGLTKSWSAATRYYKGTSLPDWTGGISNTIKYKNFDFSVLASFSIGGYIYDQNYASLMYGTVGNTSGANWSPDILNRWQSPSNPGDGKTPKLMATTDYTPTSASTRFLYDASFMRIRNITLGYSIPKEVLSKAKIANARFYIDCQNPVTFFGRKGLDPEEGGLGKITSNNSVVYKTVSVGVNFDF